MTKFTFISQYFYPSYASTAQLLTDLSLTLSTSGYNICILTSTPSHSTLTSVNITRAHSWLHQGHSITSKALDSLVDLIGIKKAVNSLPEIERSYSYCVHLHAERLITDKV